MIMTVVLDPDHLEGIHLVNVSAMGPDVAFHSAIYVSLDTNIPNGDPDGILNNTGSDIKPGVYGWLKKIGGESWERTRVYFPGNVYHVPDPLAKLRTTNRGGNFFYGNLRDLAERYILETISPGVIIDSPLNTELTRYEQKLQEFISNLIDIGDTSQEAIVEGRKEAPPSKKPKQDENRRLLTYMEGLVNTVPSFEGDTLQNDQADADLRFEGQLADQKLQELEDLVGPLDSEPENGVLDSSIDSLENRIDYSEGFRGTDQVFEEDGAKKNILRSMTAENTGMGFLENPNVPELVDAEDQNHILRSNAEETRNGQLERFNSALEQDEIRDAMEESRVDVLVESFQDDIGDPRLSQLLGVDLQDSYPFAATSTRRRPRRPVPLMADSFVDPDILVAEPSEQSQNRQDATGFHQDEEFEVGPARRMRSSRHPS
ncbi:hypothetical protein TWF730_003980 [Orbilia blumenaviensis]|uniref:Uncharacterized protein n=1 Tax=Orbilia blumenaviensis TaxID=1796055 RepID=A0AAV9U5B5_9PEZI